MAVDIELHYDADIDAWTLRCIDCRLGTQDDIAELKELLNAEFAKFEGKKTYLLIDMANFELVPSLAEAYGKIARDVLRKNALGILRYGPRQDWIASMVRLQSVIQHFPANIFPDREAALEALDKLRRR